MKNLIVRTISGIVLVAILVSGILYAPLTSFIVLSLVGLGSLFELEKLMKRSGVPVMPWFPLVAGAAVLAMQGSSLPATPLDGLAVLAILFLVRAFAELYRKKEKPFLSIAGEIFGLAYTIVPILLLNEIGQPYAVLTLFLTVWTNDVGAYLVGSTLGRHKLFERISPKKSWEGFFGGVLLATAAAALCGHFLLGGNWAVWAAVGAATALAGVAGDLFESLYKRSIAVKDSGQAIPGHGGFLDRFDALFFAAPVFYALLRLL